MRIRLTQFRRRTWTRYAAVFLLYTALSVIVLWNLSRQFTIAVPDGKDSDFYQFLWNYWWIDYALQSGQSLLFSDYTLFPHMNNLSLHTLAPIWFPVYKVSEPVLGRVASGNLMVLLSFPLTATAMFAWLRRRLVAGQARDSLAFFGGLAFTFSPYMMLHASYIQVNLTPLWWFPLLMLLWDELVDARHLRRLVTAMLLGLSLWCVWLTDLQFVVWLPFALLGYVVWTLWTARDHRERGWLVGWGALSIGIMLPLAYLYPMQALLQVDRNPIEFPPAGAETLAFYSLPLTSLVGKVGSLEIESLGRLLMWLVWLTAAVSVVLYFRFRRRLRTDVSLSGINHREPSPHLWFSLALIPLLMALGPDVTIVGMTVPLPYRLFHDALDGQYRIPVRFISPAAMLLITFMVVTWQRWLERFTQMRRWVIPVVGMLSVMTLIDVGAFDSFPMRVWPDYAIHEHLADDERDFVVLDIPVGTHNGFTGMGAGYYSMYYIPVHEHRAVNGWLARTPYTTVLDYMESPLFSWLAGAREMTFDNRDEIAQEFASIVNDWPVGYVFAYMDWMMPQQQSAWVGWMNMRPELCAAQSSPDATLIWWRARSLGCDESLTTSIDFGMADDWLYVGEGWYLQENIGGPAGRWTGRETGLRITLNPEQDYELRFSALAFGDSQTVTIVGETPIATIELTNADWQEYVVQIPAGSTDGAHLYLQHSHVASPSASGQSSDERELAAAYDWIEVIVMASG